MTTAAQLITRALYPMRDTNQSMFGDAELIDYINEAIIDLCARKALVHEEDSTVTATATGLPISSVGGGSDVLQIRWVVAPAGYPAVGVDPETLKISQEFDPDRSADEPLYAVWDEYIYLHPAPTAGDSWTVGYYGIPASLTADSDTFPLSRLWEQKAVQYLRSKMWYSLGEIALGDREASNYEDGLPVGRVIDRNAPGQVNLVWESTVWDSDPEAMHTG